jgi:hypothetical protein
MKFSDIPQFTRGANYRVNVSWKYLEDSLERWREHGEVGMGKLELDPDFQREHVWTPMQQERYLEYVFRGGESSREIHWNCAGWQASYKGPLYLVDGKQRLQAARLFIADKIKVFGKKISEFDEEFPLIRFDFIFHVNDLKTKSEVIQWYLDLNFGGTPHTDSERKRVEMLLGLEKKNE